MRLRAPPLPRPFHVVLVEPEIPPNTGNVGRLCAATGCTSAPGRTPGLPHRRARGAPRGARLLAPRHPRDARRFLAFPALRSRVRPRPGAERGRLHLFTAHAGRSYLDAGFRPGDALVFGKESVGLPDELVAQHEDRAVGIPTLGAVRSLNLANAAEHRPVRGAAPVGRPGAAVPGRLGNISHCSILRLARCPLLLRRAVLLSVA